MKTRPQRIEKPWGYELLWATAAGYAGKLLWIRAGEALSLQVHERKHETLMVLRGEVDIEFAEHRERFGPHDVLHVPPGLRHRITAVTEAELVEVSTNDLDDVIRLEDRYGRAQSPKP